MFVNHAHVLPDFKEERSYDQLPRTNEFNVDDEYLDADAPDHQMIVRACKYYDPGQSPSDSEMEMS